MVEEYYILQSKKKKKCWSCCKKEQKCKSANLEKFFYEQLIKEHNKMRSRLGYKPIKNDANLQNEARKCCEYVTAPDGKNYKTVCVYYDYEIRDNAGCVKAIYKQIDCFVVRKADNNDNKNRKHAGESDKLVVGICYAAKKAQNKVTRSVSSSSKPKSKDKNDFKKLKDNFRVKKRIKMTE